MSFFLRSVSGRYMLFRAHARNLVPFARDSSSLRSSEWHASSRGKPFVIPSKAVGRRRISCYYHLGEILHFTSFHSEWHHTARSATFCRRFFDATRLKMTSVLIQNQHSIKEFFHPQRTEDQTEKPTLFPKKFQDNLFSEESCKHHTPITRSIVLIVTLLYKELLIKPFKNTKRITDLQSITRFDILSFKFHCILQQKKESFYSVTPVLKIAISR